MKTIQQSPTFWSNWRGFINPGRAYRLTLRREDLKPGTRDRTRFVIVRDLEGMQAGENARLDGQEWRVVRIVKTRIV
jgi:hypothetical protein